MPTIYDFYCFFRPRAIFLARTMAAAQGCWKTVYLCFPGLYWVQLVFRASHPSTAGFVQEIDRALPDMSTSWKNLNTEEGFDKQEYYISFWGGKVNFKKAFDHNYHHGRQDFFIMLQRISWQKNLILKSFLTSQNGKKTSNNYAEIVYSSIHQAF